MDHRDWPQGVPNGDGAPAGFCRRLNGDDVLKNLKWIGIGLVLAMVLCIAVEGSLANTAENNYKLSIVQITLERGSNGLHLVGNNRELRPAANDTNTKATVKLNENLTLTDDKSNTVEVKFSLTDKALFTDENALDHFVVVKNTGNTVGYVRTWFAFEMGSLEPSEFEQSVILNCNSSDWVWSNFQYGVQINGENYAVVCADYAVKQDNDTLNRTKLEAGETTSPSLLQILLDGNISGQNSIRLDGNRDGMYKVFTHSQSASDTNGLSSMGCPWTITGASESK